MKKTAKSFLENVGFQSFWNRFLGKNRWRLNGDNNRVTIGKSWLTNTSVIIDGKNNSLEIGDNCRFNDLKIFIIGNSLRVLISNNCQLRGKIKCEDVGSSISIGAGTTMEDSYLGAYEGTSLQIGNDCMFARQVGLRTGDLHTILDTKNSRRINTSKNIKLERHVWLCHGVTVLKGCCIGANSIIGAKSTVTSSIPSNALAVGTPAKVIREQINWSRERHVPLDNIPPQHETLCKR